MPTLVLDKPTSSNLSKSVPKLVLDEPTKFKFPKLSFPKLEGIKTAATKSLIKLALPGMSLPPPVENIYSEQLQKAPLETAAKTGMGVMQTLRYPWARFIEHPVSTVATALQEPQKHTLGGTLKEAGKAFIPAPLPYENMKHYEQIWDNYWKAIFPGTKTPEWYRAMASFGTATGVEIPTLMGIDKALKTPRVQAEMAGLKFRVDKFLGKNPPTDIVPYHIKRLSNEPLNNYFTRVQTAVRGQRGLNLRDAIEPQYRGEYYTKFQAEKPRILTPAEQEPVTLFGKQLKQQMKAVGEVPLHPAEAGRAELGKIFPPEKPTLIQKPITQEPKKLSLTKQPTAGKVITAQKAIDKGMSAEEWVGSKPTVYHGTRKTTEISKFRPLSHFGSKKVGNSIRRELNISKEDWKTIEVKLDIKKPYRIDDKGWGAKELSFQMWKDKLLDEKTYNDIYFAPSTSIDAQSKLIEILKQKGYDSFVYTNKVEDIGSDSYIIFNSEQAKTKSQLLSEYEKAKAQPKGNVQPAEGKVAKPEVVKPEPLAPKLEQLPSKKLSLVTKTVPAPKGKNIEVLPRKEQLVDQIKNAIAKAPDVEITETTPTVTFEIDGGAKIFNTKNALKKFQEKIEKTFKQIPSFVKDIKKTRTSVANKEQIDDLIKLETKDFYSDGKILIKGTPPKSAKFREDMGTVNKKSMQELINTKTTPAELSHYQVNTEEMQGVSDKPINNKEAIVVFKVKGKEFGYAQARFNVISKMFPNADFSIAEGGMLVAKEKGEFVASLMPLTKTEFLKFQLKESSSKGGSSGSSVAASAQASKGYGVVESSEKKTKVRPKVTDYSKLSKKIPSAEKTNIIKEYLKIVAPSTVSHQTKTASTILRKEIGELAHKDVQAVEALKKAHTAFTWTSKEDGFEFINNIEEGNPQKIKELQEFADTMRDLLDDRRVAIQNLGKGQLESFYENYFPHIWKDPKKAKDVIMQIMGKRRLEGTKSFLKKRTIMTIKDGMDLGLEPVSDNPVDLVLLKLHEIDRYVMAQNIIKGLKEEGLVKFVYSRSHPPDEYSKINDNAFTVYMPPEITKKEAFDSIIVDQLMDIAKSLGIDTKRFTSLGGKRWGYAVNTSGGIVRTKFAAPESVLAHEIGHVLGYRFNLYETFGRRKEGAWKTHEKGKKAGKEYFKHSPEAIEHRRTIDEQWRKLADARYKGLDAPEGYKNYVRKSREKEAVMLEALIHAPDEFKAIAPDLYDMFTKFLNEHGILRPLLDVKPSLVLGSGEAKIKIPGFVTLGHYYAPKDVAVLINNYLSPGIRNNNNKLIANSYNLLRGVGNILNQVNLSLSLFHAINVTTDMMASTLGVGLRRVTIKGQRLQGLKDIISVPVSPVVSVWEGTRIKNAYKKQMDSIDDPKLKKMIQNVVAAGGRDRMDVFYYNQQIKALQKTFRDILKGTGIEKMSGVAKLPFNVFSATVEALAKPIMEWYVPTGKLGLFAKLAISEMQRAEAGEITDKQLTFMLTKVWDSVDNRMGQLIYDNLFWNKVLKDSLMISVRSTGWNLGSWREYAGAGVDVFTAGERVKEGDKLFSHKMAYVTGAGIVYVIMGAIITYMFTGKSPKEVKDYFFPRTGEKNPDGSDERISLPTYAKDIYAYTHRPLETVKSKQHPLIGLALEQVANKDFYNVQISYLNDPIFKQIYDRAKHIINYATPFSYKNYEKMGKANKDPLKNATISITGITSAPNYLTRTPSQKLMYRYIGERIPNVSKTKEEFEKTQYIKTLKNRYRKGEPINMQEVRKNLTKEEYVRMRKSAELPPFAETFKRLTLEEALNVYSIATEKERAMSKKLLIKKYRNAKNKTKAMHDLYIDLLRSF